MIDPLITQIREAMGLIWPYSKGCDPDLFEQVRSACDQLVVQHSWQPIESHPTAEHEPFMVLLPKNDMADFVQLQVSVFEGWMYPDRLDGLIDWNDRVLNATHWAPCLPVPV